MLGLGAGQCVEVGGQIEGVPGRTDHLGQRFLRQVYGLISHPAIIGDPLIALCTHFSGGRYTLTPC